MRLAICVFMVISHVNLWTIFFHYYCITVASSAALHCHDYPIIESYNCECMGWGVIMHMHVHGII